jgi:hypothetical protein
MLMAMITLAKMVNHCQLLSVDFSDEGYKVSEESANLGGMPVEIQNPLGCRVGSFSVAMLNDSVRRRILF